MNLHFLTMNFHHLTSSLTDAAKQVKSDALLLALLLPLATLGQAASPHASLRSFFEWFHGGKDDGNHNSLLVVSWSRWLCN